MKELMLNQKTGLKYDDIEPYIYNLNTYKEKFVVFPSSIYLTKFIESGYNVGIQNVAESNEKNQTGEITANQAKSIGVKYVLIGHSERRANQKEDSEVLTKKMNEALKAGFKVLYLIGESLVEYKLKNTNVVLNNELESVLSNITEDINETNFEVAYEPIWAIGSGMTPDKYEIEKVVKYIKDYFNNKQIENIKVLYGGSVNDENISSLCEIDELDGFLVGGASNDYHKVTKMCEIIEKFDK